MAMKSVKNVSKKFNFWQIDHKVFQILKRKGIEILSSPEAWEKFGFVRKIFEKKPKEGYFVWVKKEVDFPLTTCITIASPKVSQDLRNLLIIERGIKAKANVLCNAAKDNLYGIHNAKGKILLKSQVSLEYNHIHKWGQKDFVSPDYEFILEKGAKLIYNYQNLFPPENLNLRTILHLKENSSANINFIVNGINSKIKIEDGLFLEGKNSQGIVRIRAVGKKNSRILAKSMILANSPSKGHLDCQGLLVDKKSKISLIPALVCQNKEAQITHEASIGKISEEELAYLRMRGLSEKEAIDLICSGFLKI
jgi:Fe-S cluster assembly scaffold protein SufB